MEVFKYRSIISTFGTPHTVYRAAMVCKNKTLSIYGRVSKDKSVCDIDIVNTTMQVYYLEVCTLENGKVKECMEHLISPFPSRVREAWKSVQEKLPCDFQRIDGMANKVVEEKFNKDFDKMYELMLFKVARFKGVIKYSEQHTGNVRAEVAAVKEE